MTVDYPNDLDITYTYDALSRKLTMADAVGTTNYTYDAQTSQLTSVDGPFDDDTIQPTWDAAGRRTQASVNGQLIADHTYDAQGRMSVVAGNGNLPTGEAVQFTYSYDGASVFITGVAMPGQLSTTKTYDVLNRLVSVENTVGAAAPAVFSSFTYTYDDSDRRTRVDLADGGRWDYTYDNAGQLTGGTRYGPELDTTEGTLVEYSYQYDAMGNPAQRAEDSGVSAYTYSRAQRDSRPDQREWSERPEGAATLNLNELVSGDPPPSFDDFGAARWTCTWTRLRPGVAPARQASEDRMVAIEQSENVGGASRRRLTFTYDGQGRRRIKQEYAWNAGQWVLTNETQYIWDGWLCIEERDVTSGLTRRYVRGLDLAGSLEGAGGIGGILAVQTNVGGAVPAATLCFFYDGNGNVTELVDPVTGSTAAHYEYSPFGKTLVASGPLADLNGYRFSTKEQDTTGLYYYGFRYYSPSLGRWVNRDPLEERGGDNLFMFCRNTPIREVDFLGLVCCNGKPYDHRRYCCCCNRKVVADGGPGCKLIERAVIRTRIKRCCTWSWRPFAPAHCWVEAPGFSAGFHPRSGLYGTGPGIIRSPEAPGYVNSPAKTCREWALSPCDYDLRKIRRCLRAMAAAPPPIYHLRRFDCRHWSIQTIRRCVRIAKRGCGL